MSQNTSGCAVSGDRHGDIANHMSKLRSRGALRRKSAGESAEFVAAADVDDWALEDRVYREAIDHNLDLAIVERAAIAREEIVDRYTIFEVAFAHSPSPWPSLSRPSRRPSVEMLRSFTAASNPRAVAHERRDRTAGFTTTVSNVASPPPHRLPHPRNN